MKGLASVGYRLAFVMIVVLYITATLRAMFVPDLSLCGDGGGSLIEVGDNRASYKDIEELLLNFVRK